MQPSAVYRAMRHIMNEDFNFYISCGEDEFYIEINSIERFQVIDSVLYLYGDVFFCLDVANITEIGSSKKAKEVIKEVDSCHKQMAIISMFG